MAKPPTNPDLFDCHAQRLTIGSLGDLSALKADGRPARVRITDEAGGVAPQTLELVAVPKPFGGFQFFFLCEVTGKRCRTLYRFSDRLGGRFAHRDAFPAACYSIQTLSKLDRIFAAKRRTEAALRRSGLRASYAGTPTRRFSALRRRLERAERGELSALARCLGRFR